MTANVIGIRREDKNAWERRVPLVPDDVARLVSSGVAVTVQPSARRVFADGDFVRAGAALDEDLAGCAVVLAVKEVPLDLLRADTAYLFFSHTIKGQAHNMPLLRRLLDVGATLVDYERVVDDEGRRLIHFGRFAGLAGAIDGLWAFGRRLSALGIPTPFDRLRQTVGYHDLDEALAAVAAVGDSIATDGLDPRVGPVVIGVTGYGNVGGGVMEVVSRLPVVDVPAAALDDDYVAAASSHAVHVVVFREQDTVARAGDGGFDLEEYRREPDRYVSTFAPSLGRLSMLFNSIYWDRAAPRLVSRDDLLAGAGRLRLVADLSCDIDGAIEATVRATGTDDPVFVYDPATAVAGDGFDGDGIAVLAVDNLPCELPRDASSHFSASLVPFVPALAGVDVTAPFELLDLPAPLARAVVTHRGRLTPAYEYLADALAAAGC